MKWVIGFSLLLGVIQVGAMLNILEELKQIKLLLSLEHLPKSLKDIILSQIDED